MMKKGFTLIELLIVIAILALLAAFVVPQLAPISERAKLSNSVKFFSQTFYEQQTKAQTGYQEIVTAPERVFDSNYKVFGLSLSKDLKEGARIFTAANPSDPKDYASLTPLSIGRNVLSSEDSEKNIYSTIKEITVGGAPLEKVEIYFLPLSNTIVVKNKSNGKVLTEKNIQVTFANSRFPTMQEKIEINTATSILRSLPLS